MRLFMASFYRWQRERLGVLLEPDGTPRGARWSFDTENRKRLPPNHAVPFYRSARATPHVNELVPLVRQRFSSHPGDLDADHWWLPTTRAQALAGLRDFLEHRLELFGPFEDALTDREPFLFH